MSMHVADSNMISWQKKLGFEIGSWGIGMGSNAQNQYQVSEYSGKLVCPKNAYILIQDKLY